jgi:hypothetical protein
VGRASASTIVPGRLAEAEDLWYDRHRWPSWVDGFGHVVKLEGEWPDVGARLLWQSPPKGRGLVQEHVQAFEARVGQTLEVEDERLRGLQSVAFEADGDQVRVTLALDYELKEPGILSPLVDRLFIRRSLTDSLRRTLSRFANERRAEVDLR